MNEYEKKAKNEVALWKNKQGQKSGAMGRMAKKMQTRVNDFIPAKVHKVVTESIKGMVKTALVGSNIGMVHPLFEASLQEREVSAAEKLAVYKRTAAIEGAGTGAGGIMLGLADFPLLLSIKMKYLYDLSALYGYDPKRYENRLFILYIFLLAFSSDEKKKETLEIIENWEQNVREIKELDWQVFQQEYRDYIDFAKMFQLVPGIGAVVGFYANRQLLEHLGETAKFAFRIRHFNEVN